MRAPPYDLLNADGVILAAGSSARAGTFKPALDIGGKPMVRHCLDGMLAVCRRVVVVGGNAWEELLELVGNLPRVECVRNPAYRLGMFTSVKAGLQHVTAEACFILPVDTPLVPPAVYHLLAAAEGFVRIPTCEGRRGHPVYLERSVFARILSSPDGTSLRACVRQIGATPVPVLSSAVLLDIDSPADHQELLRRLAAGPPL